VLPRRLSLERPLPGARNWLSGGTVLFLLLVALSAPLAGTRAPTSPKAERALASPPPPPTAQPEASAATRPRPATPTPERGIREGTELVDQMGRFKMTGDRVTFVTSDGKMSFVGLENLNLERIARAIADNAEPLEWKVSGTVTEYGGANFLLVERAIIRPRADPRENR